MVWLHYILRCPNQKCKNVYKENAYQSKMIQTSTGLFFPSMGKEYSVLECYDASATEPMLYGSLQQVLMTVIATGLMICASCATAMGYQ